MGMTIDDSIRLLEDYHKWQKKYGLDGSGIDEATRNLIDVARKYQMFQAKYVERLKADMVAMLTELQMDIEECVDGGEGSPQFEQGVDIARCQVVDMIQQKINALKGEQINETN